MICEENKKLSPYTNGTTLIRLLTAGLFITRSAKNFIADNMKKTIIISEKQSFKQIEADAYGREVIIKIKNNTENDSMYIVLDRYDAYEFLKLIEEAIRTTSDE